jgi:hypothetical protein
MRGVHAVSTGSSSSSNVLVRRKSRKELLVKKRRVRSPTMTPTTVVRGMGGDETTTTTTSRPTIVLDGANIAWGYSAALHAAFGCKNKQPLSRGVLAALEHPDWAKIGADVVCFVPSTYVEGPLHGLADGGDLATLVPRKLEYLGEGVWRNSALYAEVERGRIRLVERNGRRSADDLKVIEYGRSVGARIISNDRYGDHKMGKGELKNYLKHHLYDYEFVFHTDADRIARGAEGGTVEVGSAFLPPPPVEEGAEETNGWDADWHAKGSSRPWARHDSTWGKRPRMKKRRSMGRVVRVRQPSTEEKWFPFWAVDDELIPCSFNPSCKF